MNGLRAHLRVLRESLQRLLATPGASLLGILVTGIALSLPVGGYLLLQSMQALDARLGTTPQISLFLAQGTDAAEIEKLGARLRRHDAIASVEFVPREMALKELQQSTELADITEGLAQNPLPDAYIIHPKSRDPALLEALRNELQGSAGVAHAQLDSAWLRKLEAILDAGRLAVGLLAGLLSFALVAITFNTIRLQILTRRQEIEVAKLIGATDAFIRRPFLYFGMLQGLFGGVAAWLLVSLMLHALNFPLGELARLYASNFSLQPLTPQDSCALLAFSAFLGWLGAWFSVSQHLWQIEPR
ncbi:permease-like cell division protein FtsX [Ferrigenium sp. UT5]|uniref:permease-like cell division protein FtsX n=1 Tax=Ferrigenium sp. UT5 TaxID=3242105 RepID=UPI0035520152